MSTFSHFLPARIGRCFATLSEKVAITSDAFIDMSSYFDMSNFSTLDILNVHFYKYAKKVVYQLDFLKINLLHKSKMK